MGHVLHRYRAFTCGIRYGSGVRYQSLNYSATTTAQLRVAENDEDKNVVLRLNWHPTLAFLYSSGSLLFSAAGCIEPDLYAKHPISGRNSRM